MAYNHEKWRAFENRRANEVEAELRGYLDAGELDKFGDLYRDKALRYLTKKRRDPLYRQFLQAMAVERGYA